VTVLAIGTLIVLLLCGLPIAFALGLAGLITLYLMMGGEVLLAIPQMSFVSIDSFILMAIPFFILAAEIMVAGGVTKHLIHGFDVLIGHLKGGLAAVGVFACMFFAAVSGSSSATAVAVGSIIIPEMIKRGYNKKYTMGLIGVAGGLGILIPPSIPLIVYGTVAEQSVGKLFMAGILPGIVLSMSLLLMALFLMRKDKLVRQERASWPEIKKGLQKASWVMVLPVIIAGGIYGGIFTPTEAAAVSVAYALFCALFVYKGIRIRDLIDILAESAGKTSMILLIIGGATVFGYMLTILHIPQNITAAVLDSNVTKVVFLLIVNATLLALGCFIDIVSILLLTSPIFIPIMYEMGINPIHFAIIFVMNMELALITPPLGMNLFIVSGILKEPIQRVLWGTLPFALVMLINLLLVTYVPWLSIGILGIK